MSNNSVTAALSTACMYPQLLEKTVFAYVENGVTDFEIFFNTDSELKREYVLSLKNIMGQARCVAAHPFTCAIETMMFFSPYERRVPDVLDYYRRYFAAMEILGAKIFVFHGARAGMGVSDGLYFERYARLIETAAEYGVTVAQENVRICMSGSLKFLSEMKRSINGAAFVLDTKQAIRAGEDIYEIVRELGGNIAHVHLSDHGAAGDCLPLGKGELDAARFLRDLVKNGFHGTAVIELYRENFGTLEELTENYRLLKEIIKN